MIINCVEMIDFQSGNRASISPATIPKRIITCQFSVAKPHNPMPMRDTMQPMNWVILKLTFLVSIVHNGSKITVDGLL